MSKILILNGPNLNMLGRREPEIYGTTTLPDIERMCEKYAHDHKLEIDFRQSNSEGVLIGWIQEAMENCDGMIINAAAYTHTSIAIHDALKLLTCPIVEVHLSDIQNREKFRHHSYIAPLAARIITGQGPEGYIQALEFMKQNLY